MLPRSLNVFTSIAVVMTFALSGCATTGALSESDDEVASASDAVSTAAPGRPERRFGPPRGPERLLVAALHELELSDEQKKTIEGALEQLGDKDRSQMQTFHKTLAERVRAGTLDEAFAKAKRAELEQQDSARRAAAGKALETLHATLTPEQREALVAHVEEQMQAPRRSPGHHHPPFPGPDGAGPEAREPMGARGPRGPGAAGPGPMGFLLHGLELREEQRAALASALAPGRPDREEMERRHEAMRARAEAALDAFRAGVFDAEAALPERPAEPPLGRLLTALQAIVPVLDEGQRAVLAARLEEGPRPPRFERHGRGDKDAAPRAPTP